MMPPPAEVGGSSDTRPDDAAGGAVWGAAIASIPLGYDDRRVMQFVYTYYLLASFLN